MENRFGWGPVILGWNDCECFLGNRGWVRVCIRLFKDPSRLGVAIVEAFSGAKVGFGVWDWLGGVTVNVIGEQRLVEGL